MTKRERATLTNATRSFYAAAADREPKLVDVPPERKRSANPRTDPTEHQLQANVIQWWNIACKGYGLPTFALFAIPNGANKSMAQRMKFKREGLRRGIPDLFLAVSRDGMHGLFIEMKRKGGTASDDQNMVGKYLYDHDYRWCICDSTESAIKEIEGYLR